MAVRSFVSMMSIWVLLAIITLVTAQASTTCSATIPCYQGCCSSSGNCGFGPDFCGDGCQGTCDAQAECGQYAPKGQELCPLNVCCSQFGYCGTTSDFCDTAQKCQSNCGQPSVSQYDRIIGYYELFGLTRSCDSMFPEDLAVGALTHLNLAFGLFDGNFNMVDDSGDIIRRASFLKALHPGLRVNIAVGGWAFNDPPTSTYFSDMASTYPNRQKFISSLISFMQKYGLDGVDIDWEYPAASDRGGKPADTENYVLLMSEIREAFDAVDSGWEATITIPTSYWYLRGFDLQGLQKYVSWFNLMSYDLHGGWDQHNKYTGPYLEGHTNVTEIDNGLNLLWRNQVDPKNVVMGYAFYGRSFTVADTSCTTPGCIFSTTGRPGDCSGTSGILLYDEIVSRNTSLDVKTVYDVKSTVKYNVYDGNQWISYDDEQSFTDKKNFMSSKCLSGLMIWAVDQDTPDFAALSGLLGEDAVAAGELEGGALNDQTAAALSSAFGAFTGQYCYVTPTCTDGSAKEQTADQVCATNFISVQTAHSPYQSPNRPNLNGQCSEGWYRHICCAKENAPKNCVWNGAPIRSEVGCSGKCGADQFLLNTDSFTDADGDSPCYQGQRNLCCDSTPVLDACFWTDCQGPIAISRGSMPVCPSGSSFQTYRYDQDNGDWCSATYVSPLDGSVGSPVHQSFGRAYCCPTGKSPQKCHWSNNPNVGGSGNAVVLSNSPEQYCTPQACNGYETEFTSAMIPPVSPEVSDDDLGISAGPNGINCAGTSVKPGFSPYFPYCCQPPSKYSDDWPVDPKYLFSTYYDTAEDDVLWHYSDNYADNDKDKSQAPSDAEDGSDAYGFVMLDGPPGSLDSEFGNTHSVVTRDIHPTKIKRSLVTTNQTILQSTFDHVEETIYVYCNHPADSPQCRKVWQKGVEDTIIALPHHIGDGPFARIVSMILAEDEYVLPSHHLRARSATRNTSPVYKLTFDYNFHLSKRSDPIEMRVDFTNLLDYWGEMTDSPASRKRSVKDEHLTKDEWHRKINAAKSKRKSQTRNVKGETKVDLSDGKILHKRWFGAFKDWLRRLTTFESKEVGYLELALQKSLLLFTASIGCIGQGFAARMSLYFDTKLQMDATYAYYFSGTILPPSTPSTYVYFGMEPSAYMGLRLTGNAKVQLGTDRKKLVDTISYPGLSVKGLAAVGPTLDIYGQITGFAQLKGEMRAGVQVDFAKSEVYWPQDDASSAQYMELLGIDAKPSSPSTQIAPTFDVGVAADAQLNVIVTPQANMGVKIGGTLTGGSIVDAQIYGQIPATLQFAASAAGQISSGSGTAASYKVGVYLLYNLVFGAKATILGLTNWASGDRQAFTPTPRYTIFENTGSFTASKRDIDSLPALAAPRRGLFDTIKAAHPTASRSEDYTSSLNGTSSMPMDMLLGRRQDPGSSQDGDTTQSDFPNPPIQCCQGDSAQVTLPDFRLNCNVFRPQSVSRPGGQFNMPGICNGIQNFFQNHALSNSESVLTWDSTTARVTPRRTRACPDSVCAPSKASLTAIGAGELDVSCDEYPFASSEEGGSFMASQGSAVNALCIPAWQNTLQGNCNKILSGLSTNVAYFERSARGDDATIWAGWGASTAGSDSYFVDPNRVWSDSTVNVPQRTVVYPNVIPQAQGITNYAGPNPGEVYGYMFLRNFTFGWASPSGPNDGQAWALSGTAPTGWTPASSGGISNDMTAVACAVNTFDQQDVYTWDYNALCLNGNTYSTGWNPRENSYSQCRIDFGTASTANTKRSIGEFNGWPIYAIEMLDNDEGKVVVPADVEPPPALLPVTRVKRFSG